MKVPFGSLYAAVLVFCQFLGDLGRFRRLNAYSRLRSKPTPHTAMLRTLGVGGGAAIVLGSDG